MIGPYQQLYYKKKEEEERIYSYASCLCCFIFLPSKELLLKTKMDFRVEEVINVEKGWPA